MQEITWRMRFSLNCKCRAGFGQCTDSSYPMVKFSADLYNQELCTTFPNLFLSSKIIITYFGMELVPLIQLDFDRFRYRAVLSPLRSHYSKRSAVFIITAVWLASFATAAPIGFVHEVKTEKSNNMTEKICGEYGWSDPQKDAAIYTYVLFSLEYAVPGLLTGFLYLRIILNLWYRDVPGMQNMTKLARQQFRNKHYRRKKTVIMLLAIFLTFMVCNLPMHVISFIYYVTGSSFKAPSYMPVITTSAEMLMYGNSAANPILYGFLHKKFSASAKALLKWIFCRKRRPDYEKIINKKKEKQVTLNSASLISLTNKRDDNKNGETKF